MNQIFMDLDSQVRQSGFVRIRDSQIWIFKDPICGIVLKIREDLLDSWNRANLWKFAGFVVNNSKGTFWNPDLFCDAQIESLKAWICDPQNNTNPPILVFPLWKLQTKLKRKTLIE